MSLYVFKETKEDGSEVYEKKIFNLDDFEIIEKSNQIIVIKKKTTIKILTFDNFNVKTFNFRNSEIISCFINNKRPSNNKYISILKDVYNIIGSGKIIIKKTKLNCETFEKKDKGFQYLKNLGISFQSKEAIGILEEIINQCLENNIKLDIEIKLFNNKKIINYVINM